MKQRILLLGDPLLYETSTEVAREELPALDPVIQDLHDTLMDFRARYQAGRAVAAPQIGVHKRLIYMYINEPTVLINPVLQFPDRERMAVRDDCMSFPGLYVDVERYKRCVVRYRDRGWVEQTLSLEGSLSELIQHEYDHLDGILATMRAIDSKSFFLKPRD